MELNLNVVKLEGLDLLRSPSLCVKSSTFCVTCKVQETRGQEGAWACPGRALEPAVTCPALCSCLSLLARRRDIAGKPSHRPAHPSLTYSSVRPQCFAETN